MRSIILGVLFLLFFVCFVAIVVEELFLGGRRRRQLERKLRQSQVVADDQSHKN